MVYLSVTYIQLFDYNLFDLDLDSITGLILVGLLYVIISVP